MDVVGTVSTLLFSRTAAVHSRVHHGGSEGPVERRLDGMNRDIPLSIFSVTARQAELGSVPRFHSVNLKNGLVYPGQPFVVPPDSARVQPFPVWECLNRHQESCMIGGIKMGEHFDRYLIAEVTQDGATFPCV